MISRRTILRSGSAAFALSITGSRGFAKGSFPSRQLRIVVANAPGGNDDTISRLVATSMTTELGQSVIVDNRGGGATMVGGATVASSAPDGYTLLCLTGTGIVQPALRENLQYGLDDFVPIIGVGGFPLALAVSASSNITSIEELRSAAQSPDGITFSTAGVGSMAHLNSLRLLKELRGKGIHVAYKNNPEGLQALMGGFTQMMLAAANEVSALRNGGKLRVLAVASKKRAVNLPDVPTMEELGFPSFEASLWYGYVAPAGTPEDIVTRLADAIAKGIKSDEFKNRLGPLAFQEDLRTGAALSTFIKGEAARFKQIITEYKVSYTD